MNEWMDETMNKQTNKQSLIKKKEIIQYKIYS